MWYYKKAWIFLKKYKLKMLLMVICMFIIQAFNTLNPLLLQRIIDDHIVGIDLPWIEVNKKDDKTVVYKDKIYKQERYKDQSDDVLSYMQIILENEQFYITNQLLAKGIRVITNQELTISNQKFMIEKLSVDDIKLFYTPSIKPLVILIAILLISTFISIVFSYSQRMLGAMLSINVTRESRLLAMAKLPYLPLDVVESEPAGKTANRIINDTAGISTLYTVSLNIYLSTIISIGFSYLGMWILDPKLALWCIIIVPIIVIWINIYSRKINFFATKTNETNSKMIGSINEIINGIGILKIFNSKSKTIDDFSKLNDQYVDEAMDEVKMHVYAGWNAANLFQGVVGAIIIIYFAYQNLSGSMVIQAGVIYAYYNYINRLISPINLLFHSFGELENAKVKIKRIFRIFDMQAEDSTITKIKPYDGNIEFKNVSYAYNGKDFVLHNINLDIKQGQKIGLVGHTGSGKSTMMNLLLRFNDIKDTDSGNIFVDSIDINSMTKRTYRQQIGIILQEPILFSGTILENILFGVDKPKQVAIDMLIKVGGQKLLDKLENGVDEILSRKGNNLSLGEKQLISFARILVSDPSIIIMDEATANIDTQTEEMIAQALEVIAKGRTTIVIAHRLSTIIDSDQIIVLEKGKIIEASTHQGLMKLDGYYANMYRAQVS